jgi:transposase/catechol 2,3-dioxygenase-like lactoylglutathione lyase family enzyme
MEEGAMAKELLPDAFWARIAPLLPPEPPKPKGGRPRVSDKAALTWILFVLKTGIPWEYLPAEMGCGSGMTCWRRLRDWYQAGVWRRLHQVLLEELAQADRIDWDRAALDSAAHGLCYTRDMTIKRLDHVSVVVDDLAAAIAFFTALGMTLEGEMPVEGPWVDRVNGLESVQVDIVMMRTPDGHGRLELTKFRNPKLVEIEPAIAPPNTLGLRSVMFTVESVDDTVARLRANGAELVGEVAQYEDKYRLCYMRGPAGIIVALAEELF